MKISSPLRVCVLHDTLEPYDPAPHLTDYSWKSVALTKEDYEPKIRALVASGQFDVFLNFCGGTLYTDDPGIEVVRLLEELKVPFTGASSDFYDPTRQQMKQACAECRIKAPTGVMVSSLSELDCVVQAVQFPMFVKHPNSYSSIGLSPHSRVDTLEELKTQVKLNLERYGQALIEEFIDGREFSVLVMDSGDDDADSKPLVFQPVEFLFPNGEAFKHEAMKWDRYVEMKCVPVRSPPSLVQELQDMSAKLFRQMNGSGYARCDIRMDNLTSCLYMLEINPNCGVLYDPSEPGTADFILEYDPRGKKMFVDTMFQIALRRQQRVSQANTI